MDGQNQNPMGSAMNNSQPPQPYRNPNDGRPNSPNPAPLNPIEHPAVPAFPTQPPAPPANPMSPPSAPMPGPSPYQPPAPQTDPQFQSAPRPMPAQDIRPPQPTYANPPSPTPQSAPSFRAPALMTDIQTPQATPPVSRPLSNSNPIQSQPTTAPASKKRLSFAFLGRFKSPKILIGTTILVIALVGGYMAYSKLTSNLKGYDLKNGNYTYSFKFYKNAKANQIGGQNSYSYSNKTGKIIVSVQPTDESPVTSCAKLGSKWQQVSSVKINGTERPICTASTGNVKAYDVIFPAQNSNHLFLVTTYDNPGSAPSDSSLKAIFSSVKV